MSDQLFRLWEKLDIVLPRTAAAYFKPKHIALLQWLWQNKQLQMASSDSGFVQQCLKEQVERIASARVDIMVEAEQGGFDLPKAEPSITAFCDAVMWWGQQSEWAEWLLSITEDLGRLGYEKPLPQPNFKADEIAAVREWIDAQRQYHMRAEALRAHAHELAWAFPELAVPYQAAALHKIEATLNARAALWSEFDALEQAASTLDWTLSIPADQRTVAQLDKQRTELEQQKEWRQQLLALNEQLRSVKSLPLDFDMPTSVKMVETARSRLDFHQECERLIAEHQRRLLPWYQKSVELPTPPYEPDRFKQYQEAVAPYLRRSRLMIVFPLVGFILILGLYLLVIYRVEI